MSAALSCAVSAPFLPNLFAEPARRARFSLLAPSQAVKVASEVLVRTLNVIAIDPATRVPDSRVTEDKRFSLALTVAVPLSLQGRPARPERFCEVQRRVRRIASERGVSGPAGRALEAARLITCAVADPEQAGSLASRAVEVAIEAEVLAASSQRRDLTEARATAERRALDICNPPRRA